MTIPTRKVTPAEMQSRIARFKELVSTKAKHAADKGIPAEVFEIMTAKTTYNVMSPANLGGQLSPKPAVVGGDAGVFRLGIVVCPPGNGPALHIHWKTHETFIALDGRWEIQWGDEGQDKVVLEPYDLIAVPPRVARRFVNTSEQDARLMVIIQGQPDDFDDVGRMPSTAQMIAEKYGPEMVQKLEANGWTFVPDARAPRDEPVAA
jgi:uncharacterized RmlC-like cupin family protein